MRYFGDLQTGGFNLLPMSISRSLPADVRCLRVTDDLPMIALKVVWRPGAGRAVEAVAALLRVTAGA